MSEVTMHNIISAIALTEREGSAKWAEPYEGERRTPKRKALDHYCHTCRATLNSHQQRTHGRMGHNVR